MTARPRLIDPEARRRQREFIKWMKTQARVVQLVCLISGHIFPDPFSGDLEHAVLPAGERGRKLATIQLSGGCQREVDAEHCGTIIRKLLGPGGVISQSKPIYDYESWYRVPPELLDSGWLTAEQRGIIRNYLYVELPGQRRAEIRKREQEFGKMVSFR
jgi:hypothetical protein